MQISILKLSKHFKNRRDPGRGAGVAPKLKHENLYKQRLLKFFYKPLVGKIMVVLERELKKYMPLPIGHFQNAPHDFGDIARQMMSDHNPWINWSDERDRVAAITRGMFEQIDSTNRREFVANINKAIGVDAGKIVKGEGIETKIRELARANADLIVTVPKDLLPKLQNMVTQGLDRGDDFFSLKQDLFAAFEQESWKITRIARDQVSKFNADLNSIRQQELGVTHYTWVTSGDERVRDEHAAKEGLVFAWDSPPPDTGHPGEDIQCRCYADPVLVDLV